MIFDSDAQKNFMLDAVRKYPTNYETALNLANAFGQALQDGRVIDPKEQLKALPMTKAPKVPAQVTVDAKDLKEVAGNGNQGEGQEQTQPEATKGPAIP
jgi:hypothetical protein